MNPWSVFPLFAVLFLIAIPAFAQTKTCIVGDAVCPLDSSASGQMSAQAIQKMREKIERFLSADDSDPTTYNPHIYVNIVADILLYPELVDLAERVVKKGIEINTIENLQRSFETLFPDWDQASFEHQQNLEFGRLYSHYAWILWKKRRLREALEAITKAMDHKLTITSDDYLRLGVIQYYSGHKQQGWDHVIKALMMDTMIDYQDSGYHLAIGDIITDKYGIETDPVAFISEYRMQHADILPDLDLMSLDGDRVRLDQHRGQVIFLNFFSPTCGSCRQEIPSIRELYMSLSSREDTAFLFVLNKPDLKQEALDLLEQSGIQRPIILTLERGSAYDLISGEPSIWIADKSGKVIFRHSGYRQGDEITYHRWLSDLLKTP